MANMVTGGRIICSIILLFLPVFSPPFYLVYLLAGLTDMIDGTIARKTHTASAFGAKLDTFADMVLVVVCLGKMIPALSMPGWLHLWIGVIACIKVSHLFSAYIVHQEFVVKHTLWNKVTGFVLFILPLTLSIVDLTYSGSFVCLLATWAALQGGLS